MRIKHPTETELDNLAAELRLAGLGDPSSTPPTVRRAENEEQRRDAWRKFARIVWYKRQFGGSPF